MHTCITQQIIISMLNNGIFSVATCLLYKSPDKTQLFQKTPTPRLGGEFNIGRVLKHRQFPGSSGQTFCQWFINNKHNSVRIYSICWSQLYLFLNSTIYLTILTNCGEIGPLYMTNIQIRSCRYAHIRPGSGNPPSRPETGTCFVTVPWN